MFPEDLDPLILAAVKQHEWRKVARIIAKVGRSLAVVPDEEHAVIAARIATPVEMGNLEAQGDLNNWRFGVVRLSR